MQGPSAATVLDGSAPRISIAATVFRSTPAKAPFHPAWAAPTTRAAASANRTGPQSAASTPSPMPGRSVTMASQRGRVSRVQGSVTVATRLLWHWYTERRAGSSTPSSLATRRRFSVTAPGSSREPCPPFSDA